MHPNLRSQGWHGKQDLDVKEFRCGYCGNQVASAKGYALREGRDASGKFCGALQLCPSCNYPSIILPGGTQIPGEAIGSEVRHVPEDVHALFLEARRSATEGCHTGAVLICRKILAHLAVDLGAEKNSRFIEYVEYIASRGFVPPNGKHWVDHIRKKGNEATHEIVLMTEVESKELILFVEMLLRFIYEFPSLVPKEQ